MTRLDWGLTEDCGPSSDGDSPTLKDLVEKVEDRRKRLRRGVDESDDSTVDESRSDMEQSPLDVPNSERSFGELDTNTTVEAILEVIGDASNLLLLGPLLGPADHDLCTTFSTGLVDSVENLLLVTLTESPDERVNVFRGHLGDLPPRTVVLNVGDSTRSAARETVTTGEGGSITIDTISDPTDLQRLGISINKHLAEWDENDGDTVLCFHSLTALLQFVEDPKTIFRFLHILRSRIQSTGATAHYHMDASAHGEQLLTSFRPLFDEVLTYSEDGTLSVEH